MPSIINSDDGVVSGTSGLKTTGGNDGLLNIQSNGSTVVAVTGSGISVTGTVSQTGVSTFAAGTVSAPSITFTGDTNTGIFSPAADTIAFTEGGTEAMRITSDARVGIGTDNPVARFQIEGTGTSGQVTASWILENASSGTVGMDITGAAGSSYLRFLYGGGPGTGTNSMTETMRIGLEGASAGVQQIKFAATQVASSDANTLDDYEEGTFTVGVKGSNTAGTYTITSQTCAYVKIGRVVTVTIAINGFSAATGGTGYGQITGLPFVNSFATSGVFQGNSADFSANTLYPVVDFISSSGQTIIYLREVKDNAGGSDFLIGGISTSTSGIVIGLTYLTST